MPKLKDVFKEAKDDPQAVEKLLGALQKKLPDAKLLKVPLKNGKGTMYQLKGKSIRDMDYDEMDAFVAKIPAKDVQLQYDTLQVIVKS